MARPLGSKIDLLGKRFGLLTVTGKTDKTVHHSPVFRCKCDCGEMIDVMAARLRKLHTRSCGCLRRATAKYGGLSADNPLLYASWRMMNERCANPENASYARYGGRGITVCERWKDDFRTFMQDMGERPTGGTLERVDNDKNYSPENCVWTTRTQQARNRRSTVTTEIDGKLYTIASLAEAIGADPSQLGYLVYRRKMSIEQAARHVALRKKAA